MSEKNIVKLIPVQMQITQYEEYTPYYIFPVNFHVEGSNEAALHKFMTMTKRHEVFDWELGDNSIGYLKTEVDGQESMSWFSTLCNMLGEFKRLGITVEFDFIKSYMTNYKAILAIPNRDILAQCTAAETANLVDSYIWYMRKSMATRGIPVKSKTDGKCIYTIDVYRDRFRIAVKEPAYIK